MWICEDYLSAHSPTSINKTRGLLTNEIIHSATFFYRIVKREEDSVTSSRIMFRSVPSQGRKYAAIKLRPPLLLGLLHSVSELSFVCWYHFQIEFAFIDNAQTKQRRIRLLIILLWNWVTTHSDSPTMLKQPKMSMHHNTGGQLLRLFVQVW